MPQVTLDATLEKLYGRDSSYGPQGQIALVLCAASSEIAPTSRLLRNTKYLYQDSTFSSTPQHISSEEHDKLQRIVAIKYLSLVPQHDAFAAGKMPVILFDPQNSGKRTIGAKEEAEKTMNSLIAEQRPSLLFFPGPGEISMEENSIDLLAAKMELDELERFPLAIDLDTHYFLNSKAALCTSGLPRLHASNDLVPESCTGTRGRWLSDRIAEILARVSAQPIPFVLKNQQTFGGGGTFVISSSDDLLKLKADLSTRILPKLLSEVNSSNAHLKPATLILSEMITNPIGDWGLTFFVTRTGESVFLAATRQIVGSTKAWIGSKVSYLAQDSLRHKFNPIMLKIGAWLHRYGYFGPCGADILETAGGNDDGNTSTTMQIVDLNVRTSGSLVLGLLKGHFSVRKSLHEASSFSITVKMTREEFVEKFEDEFADGKMIVVSWFEDVESGISYGNIITGAPDEGTLDEKVAKVKQMASEIHF
ncbi:MAG: hypothetical protein Q9209_003077 [Squamulea sp. 1 TL-2023]